MALTPADRPIHRLSVDDECRRLEVRRERGAGGYRSLDTFGPEVSVAPLGLDLPPLALAGIL